MKRPGFEKGGGREPFPSRVRYRASPRCGKAAFFMDEAAPPAGWKPARGCIDEAMSCGAQVKRHILQTRRSGKAPRFHSLPSPPHGFADAGRWCLAKNNANSYIPIISYHRHKFAFDSYTNSPFSKVIIYENAMLLGQCIE